MVANREEVVIYLLKRHILRTLNGGIVEGKNLLMLHRIWCPRDLVYSLIVGRAASFNKREKPVWKKLQVSGERARE